MNECLITEKSNIIDYLEKGILNIFNRISDELLIETIPYQIMCKMDMCSTYDAWIKIPFSSEHRSMLIMHGVKTAEDILESFISHRDSLCITSPN